MARFRFLPSKRESNVDRHRPGIVDALALRRNFGADPTRARSLRRSTYWEEVKVERDNRGANSTRLRPFSRNNVGTAMKRVSRIVGNACVRLNGKALASSEQRSTDAWCIADAVPLTTPALYASFHDRNAIWTGRRFVIAGKNELRACCFARMMLVTKFAALHGRG
jgi:hypothetical protein